MGQAKASTPRYAQLAQVLQEEIINGQYPVGSPLPSEQTLCEQYDVSRHTVREALRQLREKGFITSQQGSSSKVANTTPPKQYLESCESWEDIVKFQLESKAEILTQALQPMEAQYAHILNIDKQQLWLKLTILRFNYQHSPLMISEIYLDAKFKDLADRVYATCPFSQLIEREYGLRLSELQQDITAVTLTEAQQALLRNLKQHNTGLRAIRRYYTDTEALLFISIDTTPASDYTYSMRMKIATKTN